MGNQANKYTMIIVEDEYYVTEGLCSLPIWEVLGIEILETCENGTEGLKKIVKLQPDIVLTDVVMDEMSGIEMLEELVKYKLKTKFILFTGHENFEYARTAFRLGASDYITKPSMPEDIMKTVGKVIASIESENVTPIEKKQEKDLARQLTADLLKRKVEEHEIERRAEFFGELADRLNQQWCCVLVEVSISDSSMDGYAIQYNIQMAVSDIADQFKTQLIELEDKKLGVKFIVCSDLVGIEMDSLVQLQNRLRDKYHINTQFTVGENVEGLVNVADSSYSTIFGENVRAKDKTCKIVMPDAVERLKQTMEPCVIDTYKIRSLLLAGDMQKTFDLIENAIENVFDMDTMNMLLITVTGTLTNVLTEHSREEGVELCNKMMSWKNNYNINSINELKQMIKTAIRVTGECIQPVPNGSNARIIKQMVKYVNKNYHDYISLSEIAEEIYLTPSYLSTIFKNEMNMVFSDYVKNYRIERAKDLLTNTNQRINQIGISVGICNAEYFGRVFKKCVGVTPSEYRKNVQGNDKN